MRNYISLVAIRGTNDPSWNAGYNLAFGSDWDEAAENMLRTSGFDTLIVFETVECWLLLDKDLVLDVLNSYCNQGVPVADPWAGNSGMFVFESPRLTWSHGH